jgi:hypothetical protein
MGQATVEVYRYVDGSRRKARFTIQPGDAIFGIEKEVEFETGYFLVDVYADLATERAATDRRPSAVAVVQNSLGDVYEIRIPKDELGSETGIEYFDEAREAEEAEKERAEGDAKKDDASGTNSGTPSGGGSGGAGRSDA